MRVENRSASGVGAAGDRAEEENVIKAFPGRENLQLIFAKNFRSSDVSFVCSDCLPGQI